MDKSKEKNSILQNKQFICMLYGMTAGLAFFAWGVDAVLLVISRGALPWTEFFPGLFICTIAGGVVGWLTIRFEIHLLAVGIWTLLVMFFPRLIIWTPLKITPFLIKMIDQDLGIYLKYPLSDSLNQNARYIRLHINHCTSQLLVADFYSTRRRWCYLRQRQAISSNKSAIQKFY